MKSRRVQIARDLSALLPRGRSRLVYRDLVDDGGPILRFSRGGFVERDAVKANRWTVEPLDDAPGWEERQGWPPVWKG